MVKDFLGMEEKAGMLAERRLADVMVFDGTSPFMVCATQHDRVAAVVLHSSMQDVEMGG